MVLSYSPDGATSVHMLLPLVKFVAKFGLFLLTFVCCCLVMLAVSSYFGHIKNSNAVLCNVALSMNNMHETVYWCKRFL